MNQDLEHLYQVYLHKVLHYLIAFYHLTIVHAQQHKKHYVKIKLFNKILNNKNLFLLADPYFEHLHDPMEEPSAEVLNDEHQDATYAIARWKCKF